MEAAGSNPAPSTVEATPPILLNLKKQGYADNTLEGYGKRLRHLEGNTDLGNPKAVKAFIAGQSRWCTACKESRVNAYGHYVDFYGLPW